jgi:hypothetical protein
MRNRDKILSNCSTDEQSSNKLIQSNGLAWEDDELVPSAGPDWKTIEAGLAGEFAAWQAFHEMQRARTENSRKEAEIER